MSERPTPEPAPASERSVPSEPYSAADGQVFSEPAYGNLPVPDLRDGLGSTAFGKSYGFPDPSPTFEPPLPSASEE